MEFQSSKSFQAARILDLLMLPEEIHEDFTGIMVQTNDENVQKGIKMWKMSTCDRNFKGYLTLAKIKKNLTKYGRQGLIDLDTESKEWQNWCDDVILYFTLRYVLTKEPIPLLSEKTVQRTGLAFGLSLMQTRWAKKMSQEDLATKINETPQVIQQYERAV